MSKVNHNWELLALARFVLAMVVLMQHIPKGLLGISTEPWYSQFGAFEAVLGFLLISGLSIGVSIQKSQQQYFKRRLQRIYPIYLVSIILHFIVAPQPLSWGFALTLLLNLTFLNQILTPLSYVVVAWSLSLEVWLYALAPALFKLPFKGLMLLVYLSFGAFIVHVVGRAAFGWPYYAGISYGINLLLLAFIWIAGFAYSLYPEKRRFIAINVGLLFTMYLGATAGVQLISDIRRQHSGLFLHSQLVFFVIRYLLLVLVFAVVFLGQQFTALSPRSKRVLGLLGNISYPLYLTHHSVFIFLNRHGFQNIGLSILIALAVAFVIYYLFDFYSKRRVVAEKQAMNPLAAS